MATPQNSPIGVTLNPSFDIVSLKGAVRWNEIPTEEENGATTEGTYKLFQTQNGVLCFCRIDPATGRCRRP